MYIVKIGEQNNRDIVAYSNNKRFITASVNYADVITARHDNIQVIDKESLKNKLLKVGI
jgi:hypothetical protein